MLTIFSLAAVILNFVYQQRRVEVAKPPMRVHRLMNQNVEDHGLEIKIMSYNILADVYTGMTHGHHLNRDHLDFSDRSAKIISEIRQSDADIVCLQEVDHFEDTYKPVLEGMGYEFRFEYRRRRDAVLIAFKADKYLLLDS